MAWTRRGFLGAALAMVGTAVFDPIGKLWRSDPAAAASDGFYNEPVRILGHIHQDAALEFDDLTQRIARRLGERLADGPALILTDVEFDQRIAQGLIRVSSLEGDQLGRFEPAGTRILTILDPRRVGPKDVPDRLTAQLLASETLGGLDVYAPIAGELRPGEPFDRDTAVALGRCPETGVMVRVLRFESDAPGRSGGVKLGLEVAAGAWYTKQAAPDRRGAWRV